jgi:hypothetical protein
VRTTSRHRPVAVVHGATWSGIGRRRARAVVHPALGHRVLGQVRVVEHLEPGVRPDRGRRRAERTVPAAHIQPAARRDQPGDAAGLAGLAAPAEAVVPLGGLRAQAVVEVAVVVVEPLAAEPRVLEDQAASAALVQPEATGLALKAVRGPQQRPQAIAAAERAIVPFLLEKGGEPAREQLIIMRAALFDAALFDDGAAVLCHPVILSSRRPLFERA